MQILFCIYFLIIILKQKAQIKKSITRTVPTVTKFDKTDMFNISDNRICLDTSRLEMHERQKSIGLIAQSLEVNEIEDNEENP